MQGTILALVIVMAFRLDREEKVFERASGENKQFILSYYRSDHHFVGLYLSPYSVISMSILYVLTLHHRGDVTEKDGYVIWWETELT